MAIGGQLLVQSGAFHLVGEHGVGDFADDLGGIAGHDAAVLPDAFRFEEGQCAHDAPFSYATSSMMTAFMPIMHCFPRVAP